MTLRYLGPGAVRRVLPMSRLVDTLAAVMADADTGAARAPERFVSTLPRGEERADGVFLVMPGTWTGRSAAAAKVISFVPDNPAAGRPTVQGLAVLLDIATGAPRLVADAATLTTLRTGALVGLGTRHLARAGACSVGIVGAGAIARDLVEGVAAVRPIESVVAASRTRARAEALVADLPWPGTVVDAAPEVARRADIVITATTSLQPLLGVDDLRPGLHLNAVGNFSPTGREVDGAAVAACRRWVDDLQGALAEAGELLLAASEGRIPEGEAGVVGDLRGLASGRVAGRGSEDEITLFKSVGTALADVGALVLAAELAEENDVGVRLTG